MLRKNKAAHEARRAGNGNTWEDWDGTLLVCLFVLMGSHFKKGHQERSQEMTFKGRLELSQAERTANAKALERHRQQPRGQGT